MKTQIGISRIEEVPEELISEFVEDVSLEHVDVQVRTHGSVFAGIEWLMPTAIFLFLTRAYFDSIFSEMGKDHYKALKRGVGALYRRASALKVTWVGTSSKVSNNQKYTPAFSILVALSDELAVKLLIQPTLSEVDAERAITAFFDLIKSTSDGSLSAETIERLGPTRVIGRTLLVAYDFERGTLAAVDPLDRPKSDQISSE